MRRKTPQEYAELGLSKGLIWNGPEVHNNSLRTYWVCKQGHRFSASYANIRNDYGCSFCSGHARKTEDDYHVLAKSVNYQWVGKTLPEKTKDITQWVCSNGHDYTASYDNMRTGFGCRKCSTGRLIKNRQLSREAYAEILDLYGLEWIGEFPQNSRVKTEWRCQNGHTFFQTLNKIKSRGSGCPYCNDIVNGARVSKMQRKIHKMIGGELNYPVGRYRIDIALPSQKIAVEYDGSWYHNESHDKKRDKKMIEQGWHILRIKSGRRLPSRAQLDEAIALLLAGETYTEIILSDWETSLLYQPTNIRL